MKQKNGLRDKAIGILLLIIVSFQGCRDSSFEISGNFVDIWLPSNVHMRMEGIVGQFGECDIRRFERDRFSTQFSYETYLLGHFNRQEYFAIDFYKSEEIISQEDIENSVFICEFEYSDPLNYRLKLVSPMSDTTVIWYIYDSELAELDISVNTTLDNTQIMGNFQGSFVGYGPINRFRGLGIVNPFSMPQEILAIDKRPLQKAYVL